MSNILSVVTGLTVEIQDGVLKYIGGNSTSPVTIRLSDYCNEIQDNAFHFIGETNITFVLDDKLKLGNIGQLGYSIIDITNLSNSHIVESLYKKYLSDDLEFSPIRIKDRLDRKLKILYEMIPYISSVVEHKDILKALVDKVIVNLQCYGTILEIDVLRHRPITGSVLAYLIVANNADRLGNDYIYLEFLINHSEYSTSIHSFIEDLLRSYKNGDSTYTIPMLKEVT